MKRLYICMFLTLAVLASAICFAPDASALTFSDESEIRYKEAVNSIANQQIMGGYTDGSFRPNNYLSRGAAAKLICNLCLSPETSDRMNGSATGFGDVPRESPYSAYIGWCSSQGIISGYSDGTFRPYNMLSTGAYLKMLLCFLGYDQNIEHFTGTGWSNNVFNLAQRIGLTSGHLGTISAGSQVTREEAALYAWNAQKAEKVTYINGQRVVDNASDGSRASNRDQRSPEPLYPSISIQQLSYRFANDMAAFGYPPNYRIPLERYTLVYGNTALAKEKYREDFKSGTWGGNCYGMTTTSGILFQNGNGISASSFNTAATTPYQLNLSDRSSALGLNLKEYIEAMQISQKSATFSEAYWENQNNLSGLCQAVSSFQTSGDKPVIVCVYGTLKGKKGGHALLGYRLETVSNTQSRLYVYDCNYPNDGNRWMTIMKSGSDYTGWSYEITPGTVWGNVVDSTITYIPYDTYWSDWNNHGSVEMDMSCMTSNITDAVIYDVQMNVMAEFQGGEMTYSRGGVYPVVNLGITSDGYIADNLSGFSVWLPANEVYTVANRRGGMAELSLVNVDKGLSVSTTAETLTLAAEDRTSLAKVSISESGQEATISLISGDDTENGTIQWSGSTPSEGELSIQISGLQLMMNGISHTAELKINGQSITVESLDSGMVLLTLPN